MKKFLLLMSFVVYIRGHSLEKGQMCENTPNVYCNCGTEGPAKPTTDINSNMRQGRPGKSGIQGEKGQKGSTGQKGEPGASDDTTENLRLLENRLVVLNITDQNTQSILKIKMEELSKTIEEVKLLKLQMKTINESFLTFPRTCDDVNVAIRQSGTFIISPDPIRVRPFYVFCNFTGNFSESVIHHDSENEIRISSCEPVRCYKRTIQYNASMQQIKALIQRSSQCRQFIKYRCINSVTSYGGWFSRNGTLKTYWGGATSKRNNYCSCGETGNCVNKHTCNCNANDNTERYDEGYLTDKTDLPVTEMQFGDTGDSVERGWHTLGPLICSS